MPGITAVADVASPAFEALERRVLLSADVFSANVNFGDAAGIGADHGRPAVERALSPADDRRITEVDWNGASAKAFQGEWVVDFGDARGRSAGLEASLKSRFGDAVSLRDSADGQVGLITGDLSWEQIRDWSQGQRGIASIQPNFVYEIDATFPSEQTGAGFDALWGLNNTGQYLLDYDSGTSQWNELTGWRGQIDADIDAPEAWDTTTGSHTVVIGVIDSGIDYTHPDLYRNIFINQDEIPAAIATQLTDTDGDGLFTFLDLNEPVNQAWVSDLNANGYIDGGDLLQDTSWENGIDEDNNSYVDDLIGGDFSGQSLMVFENDPMDEHFHGTHVAGTIGASGNNGVGVTGVNWDVQLVPLRLGDTSFSSFSIRNAINYLSGLADAGANVVASNNSYGGGSFDQLTSDAIEEAYEVYDILYVASAGNNFRDNNDTTPYYPAGYDVDGIISVAASDFRDNLAYFSNFGPTAVDLAAPGVNVFSTVPGGGYGPLSGTSMAAPHVTGVIGLLAAADPTATAQQRKGAVLTGVDLVPQLDGFVLTSGRLNAADALVELAPTGPRVTAIAPGLSIAPTNEITLTFDRALDPATVTADNFALTGTGADGEIGTADDVSVTITNNDLSLPSPGNDQVKITLASNLAADDYRITVDGSGASPLTDSLGAAFFNGNSRGYRFEVTGTDAFVVDTVADEHDFDFSSGDLSLREALRLADANPGHSTITFDPGLSGQTITLNSGLGLAGELEITTDLTLDGTGSDVEISGGGTARVFSLYPSRDDADIVFRGLTVRDGFSVNAGAGVLAQSVNATLDRVEVRDSDITTQTGFLLVGSGVAVLAGSDVTIRDSLFQGNTVTRSSGDLFTAGGGLGVLASQVAVETSRFSQNEADGLGGGVAVAGGADVSVVGSTFENNIARHSGGGLHAGPIASFAPSNADISDSLFTQNTALVRGGGVRANGLSALTVTNTTVSGNTADEGGGLSIGSGSNFIPVTHSTITGNTATGSLGGGGIRANGAAGTVRLDHTIVAENSAPTITDKRDLSTQASTPNVWDTASGHNLIGALDPAGPENVLAANGTLSGTPTTPLDPQLGALADNGGPTQTHALLAGSPAIDAGDAAISAAPDTDQRGPSYRRIADGDGNTAQVIDIGAYEIQDAVRITAVTISGSSSVHEPYVVPTGSGAQLLPVGVGGADTISLTFNANVQPSMAPSYLRVVGLNLVKDYTTYEWLQATTYSYDAATNTASWTFTDGMFEDGQFMMTLSELVTDSNGNSLDGDWVNPTDVAQAAGTPLSDLADNGSGDGTPGGDFKFVFSVLAGDTSGDGRIEQGDLDNVLLNWGMTGATYRDGDANGDGFIGQADLDAILLPPGWGANYQALNLLGDIDDDFDVDMDDFNTAMNNMGTSGPGDADGDGDVDIDDLILINQQLGIVVPV